MDSVILNYHAGQFPCHLQMVGNTFNPFGLGLAFRRDSRYTDSFNRAILKLQSEGFLSTLEDKWISGACSFTTEGQWRERFSVLLESIPLPYEYDVTPTEYTEPNVLPIYRTKNRAANNGRHVWSLCHASSWLCHRSCRSDDGVLCGQLEGIKALMQGKYSETPGILHYWHSRPTHWHQPY